MQFQGAKTLLEMSSLVDKQLESAAAMLPSSPRITASLVALKARQHDAVALHHGLE